MNKVAILYICTGKYEALWKDFYLSFDKYFLKKSEVHYYVFTDANSIYSEENPYVHKVYQKMLGWPNDTLMRFRIFSQITNQLDCYDYLFFSNANLLCVDHVLEEAFLPIDKELLMVQHPGFYNKSNLEYTYDRNPKSTAFIPEGKGTYYVCGGLNGGKKDAFIQLIHALKENTDIDNRNGVIALWHDESHLNKYILDRNDYKLLPPSYCYPEDWDIPYDKIIMVRQKSKIFDVDSVKKGNLIHKLATIFKRNK